MAERVEVDATGLLCPLPVLRARKRLAGLPPGAEIALLATDPAAVVDVPHFCAEAGHSLVSTLRRGDGTTVYIIRRGG